MSKNRSISADYNFCKVKSFFLFLGEFFVRFVGEKFNYKTMGTATLPLESIWQLIHSLSIDNRRWLNEKISESIAEEEETCDIDQIEDLLKNGRTLSKKQAKFYLEHYKNIDSTKPYTQEELMNRIRQSEKSKAEGKVCSNDEAMKYIDTLVDSLMDV